MATGVVKIYWDRIRIKELYFQVSGVREGLYQSFHYNGKLNTIANFVNGELVGEQKTYLKSGELYSVLLFLPDNIVEQKTYYNNGALNTHCFTIYGLLHGVFKDYYINGKIREESNYFRATLSGPHKQYYENGQLLLSCIYHMGYKSGEYLEYHNNGQLFKKCYFVNGDRNGDYYSYSYTGELQEHYKFVEGHIIESISNASLLSSVLS